MGIINPERLHSNSAHVRSWTFQSHRNWSDFSLGSCHSECFCQQLHQFRFNLYKTGVGAWSASSWSPSWSQTKQTAIMISTQTQRVDVASTILMEKNRQQIGLKAKKYKLIPVHTILYKCTTDTSVERKPRLVLLLLLLLLMA